MENLKQKQHLNRIKKLYEIEAEIWRFKTPRCYSPQYWDISREKL